MRRRIRQRGIALITAVLVVSLAVIASTAVLDAGHYAIQRTGSMQDSERAYWYARGAETWARTILDRDKKRDVDGLDDDWAKLNGVLPVAQGEGEGAIRGQLIDLQARFNLNNFGFVSDNPEEVQQFLQIYEQQFQRLVSSPEVGLDPQVAQWLASAIRDWIDPDQEQTGVFGAEDGDYLRQTPPHVTPGRPMQSVTELLPILALVLAREMPDAEARDAERARIFARLRPYVAALPQYPSPINANTAPEFILRALVLDQAAEAPELQSFLAERKDQPRAQTALVGTPDSPFGANALPPLPQGFGNGNIVSSSSRFFMLESEAAVSNGRVALYSLMYRPQNGDTVVLGRSTDSE